MSMDGINIGFGYETYWKIGCFPRTYYREGVIVRNSLTPCVWKKEIVRHCFSVSHPVNVGCIVSGRGGSGVLHRKTKFIVWDAIVSNYSAYVGNAMNNHESSLHLN